MGASRLKDEGGAIIVLTAILLVVIVGFAALAIDVGSYYQAQRQAQGAADAAALAGADVIAASGTTATAAASASATVAANTNDPSTTSPIVTVNGGAVTVQVANSAPTYFGRLFFGSSAAVGARAVAAKNTGSAAACSQAGNSTCYAIFVNGTDSSSFGLDISAGANTVNGSIHSNGSINTGNGNSNFVSGWASYNNGPGYSIAGKANVAGGITTGPPQTWPVDYSKLYPKCGPTLQYQCTGPNLTPSYCSYSSPSGYSFSASPPTGLYCAYGSGPGVDPSDPSTWNGACDISGGLNGVSFICGSITTGKGNSTYTPYAGALNNLLFYAAAPNGSSDAIQMGGGGGTYNGDMFAPQGTIAAGKGGVTVMMLEGNAVDFGQGNATVNGDGPVTPPTGGTASGGSSSLLQ